MRVTADIAVSVSGGPASAYKFFQKQSGVNPLVLDSCDRTSAGAFTASDPGRPVLLSFADIPHIRGLYVEVSGGVSVGVAGSSFQLIPASQGGVGKLFLETDIAAFSVAPNDPLVSVNGTYCVWGLSPAAYAATQAGP